MGKAKVQELEEEMRVEYQMASRAEAVNPVTGNREPTIPPDESRMRRVIALFPCHFEKYFEGVK